jgi:predicted DNA-binding transcriptional regulator AlpA
MEYGPPANLFDDRRQGNQKKEIRFIRLKEVLAICGKSRSSVYDAIKKGNFHPGPSS